MTWQTYYGIRVKIEKAEKLYRKVLTISVDDTDKDVLERLEDLAEAKKKSRE